MKIISRIILGLITVSCFLTPKAVAIENPLTKTNNKFGIHILMPSELEKAASLVNSSGGDWGYVTIPIKPTERDKDLWQKFMHDCQKLHLIPILRITTIPQGGTWQEGTDTDLVDFANFLKDLDWPVKNRYVIIFNEVNRHTEWGGKVEPAVYARILKNAHTIFKQKSSDFFILAAGLDNALPSSATSMRSTDYMRAMMAEDKAIWSYVDGWNSHSYPNPAFSASPKKTGWTSITSYKVEQSFAQITPKPVFITETGWVNTHIGEPKRAEYLETALGIWNSDNNVVAVTPFILQAGAGDFVPFSFIRLDGEKSDTYKVYENYQKNKGEPTQNELKVKSAFKNEENPESPTNTDSPQFRPFTGLLKLENLIRTILGLTTKSYLQVGSANLTVELANNKKLWEIGLSKHNVLKENEGMYFIFPVAHIPIFWMKDMKFPIDIIWIKDDTIVDLTLSAQVPTSQNYETFSPKTSVNRVLEVNAGYVEKMGIKIGDKVKLIQDN